MLDDIDRNWLVGQLTEAKKLRLQPKSEHVYWNIGYVDGRIAEYCAQNAIDELDVRRLSEKMKVLYAGGVYTQQEEA